MIIACLKCNFSFEDEYRTTICPHETFAANDGKNNFAHHKDAYLEKTKELKEKENAPTTQRNTGLD